jgi:hypothetical protein
LKIVVNYLVPPINRWNAVFVIMTEPAWDHAVTPTLKGIGTHPPAAHLWLDGAISQTFGKIWLEQIPGFHKFNSYLIP